jgi:methyl-accepting chemotaxis protein
MVTTIATGLAGGTSSEAVEALTRSVRTQLQGAPPALLVVFASTMQPLGEVVRGLSTAFPDVPLLGTSTAGEFTEAGDAKSSVAIFAVAGEYRAYVGIGRGLKEDPERAVEEAIDGLPREVNGFPHRTAILLLDPLSGNGEEATLLAAAALGDSVRLAGGAAGDDLAMKATDVACGTNVAGDAVAIGLIFSKSPLGVGVCHGHEPLSVPLRITRAEAEDSPHLIGLFFEQTRCFV